MFCYSDKLRTIDMKPLNMVVTMSNALDLESTCVRGLWFRKDLLSDHCPSFYPPHKMDFQTLSVAVERETIVRKFMRKMRLDAMRRERAEYELKMEEKRRLEEEEEEARKASKDKKKAEPKKKQKITLQVEPPIVDESTYVNVDDEYVAYETNKAEEESRSLSPDQLNLQEHEVNMREFQILGGIYKIECLERPPQPKQIDDRIFIRISEFVRSSRLNTYPLI
jgi:hypothetical protein